MARYYAPLDPECPEASEWINSLLDDPMTSAMGAPVDEIIEGYEIRHRKTCKRCQEYGLANIEIEN